MSVSDSMTINEVVCLKSLPRVQWGVVVGFVSEQDDNVSYQYKSHEKIRWTAILIIYYDKIVPFYKPKEEVILSKHSRTLHENNYVVNDTKTFSCNNYHGLIYVFNTSVFGDHVLHSFYRWSSGKFGYLETFSLLTLYSLDKFLLKSVYYLYTLVL